MDYLVYRELLYGSNVGLIEYFVKSSVPQGSVLDPLLWNVTYDHVLCIKLSRQAAMLGYADGIVIVIKIDIWRMFSRLVRHRPR